MLIAEITEGKFSVLSKVKGRTVRKYRCTSGTRKGRLVSQPSTCTAPKKSSSYVSSQVGKKKSSAEHSTVKSKGVGRKTYTKKMPKHKLKPKRSSIGLGK